MSKSVMVEGDCMVKDGQSTALVFYTETFVLDDAVDNIGQARQMIQAGLITERLRKTIEGFKRVRTCQVVGFEDSTDQADNGDIDRLLLEASSLGCIPDNIDNYKRPDYKQKALEKAILAAKERIKNRKTKSETLGPPED